MRRAGLSYRALGMALLLGVPACGSDPPADKAPAPSSSAREAMKEGNPEEAAAPKPAAPVAAPAAPAPGAAAPAAPAPPTKPLDAAAAAAALKAAKDKLLAEARLRPFRPEDFTASPPTASDPFHNNINIFIDQPLTGSKKSDPGAPPPCPLFKFGLEELKLSAIILGTGDGSLGKAMFIDPTGLGSFIKRGDRIGKNCATVQRVLSDRVVFEFTEEYAPGKTRVVQRTIELYPDTGGKR